MPAWPNTLPQYVAERGYSERFGDQTIETQMEAGPHKIRRRFTTQNRLFGVQIEMAPAQAAIFDAFYHEDCAGGAATFTWVHPRTRVAGTFRFRRPAPSFRVSQSGEQVTVSFVMEML